LFDIPHTVLFRTGRTFLACGSGAGYDDMLSEGALRSPDQEMRFLAKARRLKIVGPFVLRLSRFRTENVVLRCR